MEAETRLRRHIDRLYYQAYYACLDESAVAGVAFIGKGQYPQGLQVKDARAHRELQRLAGEIDRLVTASEHRHAKKYRGGQFVNEGASGAKVIRGSEG